MNQSQESLVISLERELFQANYGVKFYSEKLSDLRIQVEQMALFAAEPSLNELTLYLGKNLIDSKSQLFQDLIIGFLFGYKKDYFANLERQIVQL